MSKSINTQESSKSIYDAIRAIALHGLVDPRTNALKNVGQTVGYVAKIHTDGDLAGTVDVQEFDNQPVEGEEDSKIGYHEGVYLSAMQDNSNGFVIVPKLYSEVTITTDPGSGREYVSMFSHVDIIQLDSHESVVIGVTEREEYDVEDEDAPDIEDLKPTGAKARTTYGAERMETEVTNKDEKSKASQIITAESVEMAVNEDSSLLLDKSKAQVQHGSGELVIDGSKSVISQGGSSVTVEDGMVSVGSTGGTDVAVLGNELGIILSELFDYIAQIKTTTQLGLQPPLNVGSFLSLKGKISKFKSQHVKIQR